MSFTFKTKLTYLLSFYEEFVRMPEIDLKPEVETVNKT